jgi:hypothetical protein
MVLRRVASNRNYHQGNWLGADLHAHIVVIMGCTAGHAIFVVGLSCWVGEIKCINWIRDWCVRDGILGLTFDELDYFDNNA